MILGPSCALYCAALPPPPPPPLPRQQGDRGDTATVGGWLRVSGNTLGNPYSFSRKGALGSLRRQLRAHKAALTDPRAAGDDVLQPHSRLAAAAAGLLQVRAQLLELLQGEGPAPTVLRLTPAAGCAGVAVAAAQDAAVGRVCAAGASCC